MNPIGLLRAGAALPVRLLDAGLRTAALAATAGVGLVVDPVETVATLPGDVARALGDVAAEVFGGTPPRRYWRGEQRWWIEVRGLSDGSLGDRLLADVGARRGVRAAHLNVPLSRVVVEVDGTESIDDLCAVVAAAEQEVGVHVLHASDLPPDPIVLAAGVTTAAVSAVGLAVTLAGRALPRLRWLPDFTAAVSIVDYQPRLRRLVEHRLGASATDTALAVVASLGYTLGQVPSSLAVDLCMHGIRVAEARSSATAWRRVEPELAEHAAAAGADGSDRPRPLPPGPVERHGDRSGLVQSVGAVAVGIASGGVDLGATAALVAAPKAARNSREAFASTLVRGLADRCGVIPIRPDKVRRLDRVDAVVIDPRVLCTGDLQVGSIRGVAEQDRASAWHWAQDELRAAALDAGWHAVPDGGEVLIRRANDPLAPVIIREIRLAAAEVVSVDVTDLDDLRSAFDDLAPDGPLDEVLAATVRRLQGEGRTVAVVSAAGAAAMAGADLAIGVLADGPCWEADVLADDLAGVWRVLHALPAARRVSERGVQIATGASVLGGLLMVPGVRGNGPAPVTVGAGAGLWVGMRAAREVLTAEVPEPAPTAEWHALSVERVRELLPPPPRPTAAPAKPNVAVGALRRVGPLRANVADFAAAMRDELSDPLTPVLAIGAAASALLGSSVDALLVGSVLTGNAALASVQRLRSERLLNQLLAVQDPLARLVDGGTVAAADLGCGSVIEVRPGDVVPADARLVETTDLEVDESSLTGESLPVTKRVAATPAAPIAERACMIHASTTVVAGTGVAIVTAVGAQTQARRAELAQGSQPSNVGLQAQLRELTDRVLPISIAGGGLVTALGVLRRNPLQQAISSGVAVSVAAVPEGLPLVATLAQQASARRLTGLGALVRSPRSIEALGRVDVVCFDKTGTLSENRLRVTRVDGPRDDVLADAIRATAPANGDGHDHATDAAVAEAATGRQERPDAHLPFRSGRPFSASIHGDLLSVKGAPEVVLAAAGSGADADRVQAMAADGLRVLAVARRRVTAAQAGEAAADPDAFEALCGTDLRLTGFLGLSDTPRPEAREVLERLAADGIGVRLITGDHPVTATAIAADLGLGVAAADVVTGAEWESMSRRDQETTARTAVVYARMSPEHKVQIVETLERLGRVCAMVGDGANDAAAIRTATVGIGVAGRGSDPARTAADVMLLDGRIGALLDALDEGRQLWQRVQAAVAVLLGGNAGEVGFAVLGTALAGRSPLNTRQLLLVNMLTDALPAAALAVSPPTSSRTGSAGRGPDEAALWRTVAVRGATTAGAATAAWALASVTGRRSRASTVALVALVSTQLGQTLIDSRSPLVVGTAVGSLLALGTLVSTPGVSHLLGSTPLGPVGWAQALTTAAGATAVAAVAPRVLSRMIGSSSTSSTPDRHSTAYNSRSGNVSARDTTITGSGPGDAEIATPATVGKARGQSSNAP